MATVILTSVPVDGTILDVDGVNRNYHSSVDGESLYGELGHLEDVNFTAGFRIRPEHIRAGETARMREECALDTLDYYDDMWPGSETTGVDQYIAVAGASCRRYLPFDCTAAYYSASIFYTVFRMRQRAKDSQDDVRTGPDIIVAVYIDGVLLEYTKRECPITYWPAGAGADAQVLVEREGVQTQHYDINHLAISNGEDPERTQAGWHTVTVRLFMPANTGVEKMIKPYGDAGGLDRLYYDINHRFRCGVRSARILALP